ncbi:uncharacterized protein F5147DRAFT_718305 [Suillus discolor]|uniref:Uncharacterized protein n=1 Tax=Suillus discolor TaxID=1912936 RepID=A0A9P7EWP9_9AGAM|nr:uncharacterized protein F5147DRAFT_718305 [Suillus discolor]KAG2095446.1 hypothetical protein F5147DRAFT_718305 [Suillus discolor]
MSTLGGSGKQFSCFIVVLLVTLVIRVVCGQQNVGFHDYLHSKDVLVSRKSTKSEILKTHAEIETGGSREPRDPHQLPGIAAVVP